MNKELLNSIKNLDMETVIDFIDEKIKEVYRDTYDGMSGWRYDISLNDEGELSVALMSTGSMAMDEYEGRSITLASMNARNEFDDYIVNQDTINELAEEKKKMFIEKFKQDYLNSEEYDEENFDIYDYFNFRHLIEIEECYIELFPNEWEELKKDFIDGYWESYERDNIIDSISNKIDELIEESEEE